MPHGWTPAAPSPSTVFAHFLPSWRRASAKDSIAWLPFEFTKSWAVKLIRGLATRFHGEIDEAVEKITASPERSPGQAIFVVGRRELLIETRLFLGQIYPDYGVECFPEQAHGLLGNPHCRCT